MRLLAIDPGTTQSAFVTTNIEGAITSKAIIPNDVLLHSARIGGNDSPVAIEMIASYGMPVGRETFETVLLIGRLVEIYEAQARAVFLVYRKDIKIHLCGTMKAKDSNIRQALIDKYGPPGTLKNPGGTYGFKEDLWSALAIADYAKTLL